MSIEEWVGDGGCLEVGSTAYMGAYGMDGTVDDEQHEALGALHEADLAQRNEGFGAGARITHHDGAGSGDCGEHNIWSSAAHGIVDQQAHVQGHVRVAVEG